MSVHAGINCGCSKLWTRVSTFWQLSSSINLRLVYHDLPEAWHAWLEYSDKID